MNKNSLKIVLSVFFIMGAPAARAMYAQPCRTIAAGAGDAAGQSFVSEPRQRGISVSALEASLDEDVHYRSRRRSCMCRPVFCGRALCCLGYAGFATVAGCWLKWAVGQIGQ